MSRKGHSPLGIYMRPSFVTLTISFFHTVFNILYFIPNRLFYITSILDYLTASQVWISHLVLEPIIYLIHWPCLK